MEIKHIIQIHYNGWTGEEGCGFKYPVSYCKNKIDLEEHKITKTKSKIEFIDPECIENNEVCVWFKPFVYWRRNCEGT